MNIALTVTPDLTFEEADARVREALAAEGFGVLTEIDVQATMKAKLDEDVAPYRILGACNPLLAHTALGISPELGLLLPCNVVVRQDGDHVVVQAMDPQMMVGVIDKPELKAVADEAGERLSRALATLV